MRIIFAQYEDYYLVFAGHRLVDHQTLNLWQHGVDANAPAQRGQTGPFLPKPIKTRAFLDLVLFFFEK